MDADKVEYNLSGHGLISTYVYQYASVLYDFLSKLNFDAKFHYTNQLGALTDSLHGAHHTRYEYIILQWYLIHNLKEATKGLGLGTNKDYFGKLEFAEDPPSVAELFQCVSILANMGHFPDTFSASKVWLDLLKKNKDKVRSGFRKGLNKEEKDILDKMIEEFDVYNIHLLNGVFLLRRYRDYPEKKELVEMATEILVDYIKKDKSKLKKYWEMYSIIRKVSYLLLDSAYAPLPFKLELSSIVTNLEQMFKGLSNKDKTLNNTIEQINFLLQDSLYLSGNSMITSTKKTIEIKEKFDKYKTSNSFYKVSVVKKLLEPHNDNSKKLAKIFNDYKRYTFPDVTWDSNNCLNLDYPRADVYKDLFPTNLVSWEEKIRKKCGMRTSMVSALKNPSGDIFKISFSLKKNRDYNDKLRSCLEFISKIITLDCKLKKSNYPSKNLYKNKKDIIKYLFKAIFGWEFNAKLKSTKLKNTSVRPYFSGRGSKSISEEVQSYLEKAEEFLSKDEKNEINMVHKVLKDLNYQGYMIVFGGSTEVWEKSGNNPSAEFDGIIILPNKKEEIFLIIVETKNKPKGASEAKKQLKGRMKELCHDKIEYKLENINNKTVVSKINSL